MKNEFEYTTNYDVFGWRYTIVFSKADTPKGAMHLYLPNGVRSDEYHYYEVLKPEAIWPEHREAIAVLEAAITTDRYGEGIVKIPYVGQYIADAGVGPSVYLCKKGQEHYGD